MNRRSFLKRLGLVPAAAVIGVKAAEAPKAPAVAPEVPLQPGPIMPMPAEYPLWPIWTVPYWQWQPYGGCTACIYPTITSAAHTHPTTLIYTSNTTAGSGWSVGK